MGKFLLILLLLGTFPLLFFQAEALMCKVCKSFKRGHCLIGKGNCTVYFGTGCRTRNFFFYSQTGGWIYNHTELDCYEYCSSENMYFDYLKIATFCCKEEDFCNKYNGQVLMKIH